MTRSIDILELRDRIVRHIARIYGVEVDEILGRCRRLPLPDCRAMLAYALSLEGYTRTEVGDELGLDHSSVTHCVQSVESRIGFAGWKDFSRKWEILADEIEQDKDAAAHFRKSLSKDDAPASEIILNIFALQSLKQKQ